MLDWQVAQDAAVRTEPESYTLAFRRLMDPAVLHLLHHGLFHMVKVGEFFDRLKRHIFYGKEMSTKGEWVPPMGPFRESVFRAGDTTRAVRLLHVGMGFITESGEFVSQLSRYMFEGMPLDTVNVLEELGDHSWYLRVGADELRVDRSVGNVPDTVAYTVHPCTCAFESIVSANINKLRARFPDKFTEFDALNRNLDEERKVLETATAAVPTVDTGVLLNKVLATAKKTLRGCNCGYDDRCANCIAIIELHEAVQVYEAATKKSVDTV